MAGKSRVKYVVDQKNSAVGLSHGSDQPTIRSGVVQIAFDRHACMILSGWKDLRNKS